MGREELTFRAARILHAAQALRWPAGRCLPGALCCAARGSRGPEPGSSAGLGPCLSPFMESRALK